ncbi:MAG TPA: hypothetical protein VGB24_12820 [Longimicrobium sp.]|jgi:hypothetical protein|uniref:hypothetical protein n=1 Tax=Longimicrobium sp. TaxID=2029185 RepID=UPI002ED8AF1F
MFVEILLHAYFVALGVPVILIGVGALAKKLIRGTSWIRQDFFLGVDLALASLSSGLIYLYQVLESARNAHGVQPPNAASADQKLLLGVSYVVVALFALLVVMSAHQDQERNTTNPMKQIIWLGVISNLVGGGLLAAFILLVQGVK